MKRILCLAKIANIIRFFSDDNATRILQIKKLEKSVFAYVEEGILTQEDADALIPTFEEKIHVLESKLALDK